MLRQAFPNGVDGHLPASDTHEKRDDERFVLDRIGHVEQELYILESRGALAGSEFGGGFQAKTLRSAFNNWQMRERHAPWVLSELDWIACVGTGTGRAHLGQLWFNVLH